VKAYTNKEQRAKSHTKSNSLTTTDKAMVEAYTGKEQSMKLGMALN
jgi:hypothetical protein